MFNRNKVKALTQELNDKDELIDDLMQELELCWDHMELMEKRIQHLESQPKQEVHYHYPSYPYPVTYNNPYYQPYYPYYNSGLSNVCLGTAGLTTSNSDGCCFGFQAGNLTDENTSK